MKQNTYKSKIVEYIPEDLEEGILYIAPQFGAALHKCMCGCGEKVSTPLGDNGWTWKVENEEVSLSPSIGSWQQECKSHYFLKNGTVQWC